MAGLVRTYNPGRDDRRAPVVRPGQRFLWGHGQAALNQAALTATGKPLPWRVCPVALEDKGPADRATLEALAASYPEVNVIRVVHGRHYLLMRLPDGVVDDWPVVAELPGRPVAMTAGQRSRVLEAMGAAADQLAAAGLIGVAAEVGFALMDWRRPVEEALRLRLPGGDLVDRLTRVATVVPQVGQLVEYVR